MRVDAGLLSAVGAGQLGAAPHVAVSPISREPNCAGAFVARPLPHAVEPVPNLPMPFDSNGAGAAIADLDDDGWLDVVLGGLHGPATVLWNRGDMEGTCAAPAPRRPTPLPRAPHWRTKLDYRPYRR